jgi:hypothetical protein
VQAPAAQVCSGFFGAGFLARSFILDPFMTVVCECVSSPRLRALKPSCGEGDVRGIRLLNRSPTFNSCRPPVPPSRQVGRQRSSTWLGHFDSISGAMFDPDLKRLVGALTYSR